MHLTSAYWVESLIIAPSETGADGAGFQHMVVTMYYWAEMLTEIHISVKADFLPLVSGVNIYGVQSMYCECTRFSSFHEV